MIRMHGTLTAILLVLLVFAAGTLAAQQRRFDPAQRVEMMKKQLSLTDEQTGKLKTILEASQKRMMAQRDSLKGDREAMRSTMMEEMKKTDAEIQKILTDEQKPIYEKMKRERTEKMRERRPGGTTPEPK